MAPNLVTERDVPGLLERVYGRDWKSQPNARFRFLLGDSVYVSTAALTSRQPGKETFKKG
jgi:hypothetical protein